MSSAGPKYRWLLVGTFSSNPTGRKTVVSGERFTTVMKRVGVVAEVPLPSGLGATAPTHAKLTFDRPRAFRLGEIVAAIDPLRRLAELGTTLARDRDIPVVIAAARVEKIVGPGGLADKLRDPENEQPEPTTVDPPAPPSEAESDAVSAGPPTVTSSAGPAPAKGESALDAIFSKVEMPTPEHSTVKNGLDAFIGAVRAGKPKTVKVAPEIAKNAAKTVQDAVSGVAWSALSHRAIASLESCWRGLRMVVAEAPGHDRLAIELLDVEAEQVVAGLEAALPPSDPHRPDAIFVGIEVTPSALAELADFAMRRQIPIVLGVSETSTGPVSRNGDQEVEAPDWTALRAHPGAQWLCAAANPVVLYNEDTELGPRIVLGSPVWGVAGILAASVSANDDLTRCVGRAGALVAPAAQEADIGFPELRTIPTANYADVPTQQRASRHGVLLFGSEPGSDQLVLVSNTTVGGHARLCDQIDASASARRS